MTGTPGATTTGNIVKGKGGAPARDASMARGNQASTVLPRGPGPTHINDGLIGGPEASHICLH